MKRDEEIEVLYSDLWRLSDSPHSDSVPFVTYSFSFDGPCLVPLEWLSTNGPSVSSSLSVLQAPLFWRKW